MDTTKFTPQSIVNLGTLNEDQLLELASWCENRSAEVEWERIQKEAAERDAHWKREREKAEASEHALVAKLKSVIKTGTLLKMKGCKDGIGLREFICWEGNKLVCWQISRRRNLDAKFRFIGWDDANTNIVTTHMPNKVQEIYVDGKAIKVRSI